MVQWGPWATGVLYLFLVWRDAYYLRAQKVALVLQLPWPSLEDHTSPGPTDMVEHRGCGFINFGKFVSITNWKIFPLLSISLYLHA